MQTLRITIQPSPETNDHQVRFVIDGIDIIAAYWKDMLGLDPDDLLGEPCPLWATLVPKSITIARCSCGIPDCDSRAVELMQTEARVVWKLPMHHESNVLHQFSFDAVAYNHEVERAVHDTRWETPDRTAARLLTSLVPHDLLARRGLVYEWASGRIRHGTLTVSLGLEPGPYQLLVHVPWTHQTPSEIAAHAAHVLSQDPHTWYDVVWNSQAPNLDAPSIAGPQW